LQSVLVEINQIVNACDSFSLKLDHCSMGNSHLSIKLKESRHLSVEIGSDKLN
jgi:hypothetical protein